MIGDGPEPRAGEKTRQDTVPASAVPRSAETEPVSSLSALGELATSMAPPSLRALAPLGLLLIAVVGVLYLARSVFIPLTFALMLSFLLSPIVTRLSRATRLPRALSAALVVLALFGSVTYGAVMLADPAAEWVRRSPTIFQTLERKIRPLRRPVQDVSVLAERVERMTQVTDSNSREVTLEKPGVLGTALDLVWQFLAGSLVMVIALYFTLLTGDSLLGRLIAWLPHLNDKRRTAEVLVSIQRGMSRYMGTIVVINTILGAVVSLAFYLLRLPNPLLWGAFAAVAHFVPYVGSLVGVGTIAIVSLVSFNKLSDAVLPPLVYLILASLEGNIVSPLVLGRTFRLDALVVFVWLLFCAWLWGVAGAIIAVPLLVLIRLTCEKSPALAPIATLIARDDTAPH
jgi:predicted PurR-regulated permease PerM